MYELYRNEKKNIFFRTTDDNDIHIHTFYAQEDF